MSAISSLLYSWHFQFLKRSIVLFEEPVKDNLTRLIPLSKLKNSRHRR